MVEIKLTPVQLLRWSLRNIRPKEISTQMIDRILDHVASYNGRLEKKLRERENDEVYWVFVFDNDSDAIAFRLCHDFDLDNRH